MQRNTSDIFQELVLANSDVATSMHAMYMLRRFRSLGILADYVQKNGDFLHLRIPANDGSHLEIRPITMYENGVATVRKSTAQPAGGHQELILVVDDEAAVRNVAGEALRELGYRVLSAPDGRAALNVLKEYPAVEIGRAHV